MTLTVSQVRALLAGLPDNFIVEADTAGDYDTVIKVLRPDYTLYDELENLEPNETPEQRAARLKAEAEADPKKGFADFLDGLVNDGHKLLKKEGE